METDDLPRQARDKRSLRNPQKPRWGFFVSQRGGAEWPPSAQASSAAAGDVAAAPAVKAFPSEAGRYLEPLPQTQLSWCASQLPTQTHTHTHRPATLATGASWCGSLSLTCRGNTMSCCALPVFLSAAWMVTAPAGQHPFSPYPGGGGETVGAASERRRERCAGTSLLTPFFTDSSSRACIGKSPSFFHSCRDCDENSQRGLNLWQGACGRGADARRACLASPEDWPEACG
jgi:hypothetical protein